MDNQEMTRDIVLAMIEKTPFLREWHLNPEKYAQVVVEYHKTIAAAVNETWLSKNVVAGPGGQ